tara:strand:- start:255 stop:980 length:726 start_codon:yes stop_codon:yes gene_type:complete
MKKILIFFTFISGLICQTTIDTLSVTVYPEFSYPGVAIEYKFDKNSNDNFIFPVPTQVDSVLYTVTSQDSDFEEIIEVQNNSLKSLNQNGNHTIYLFLDKYIKNPGPRDFSYLFSSNQDINTLILGVQIPFASEDFNVESSNITFEKVRDQNGLTFFQSISNNYLKNKSSDIYLSYYNPHGNTSIEYAANISTQDTDVEVPKVASDRFVRYPFLTWEPMIIFILLTIFMVLFYEINLRKND